MAEQWQTVTKACQTLGVSERTLYRRMARGEIEYKQENNRRFIKVILPDDKEVSDTPANVSDSDKIQELEAKIAKLEATVAEKDRIIEDARRAAKIAEERKDTLILRLTEQNQMLLEDKRPFTERLRSLFSRNKNIQPQ